MAIGILPMLLRKIDLPSCPVEKLEWPNQEIPIAKTVGDLGPDDQIVVYPNSDIFFKPRPKLKCKVSLVITEPKAIHAKYYRLLLLIRHRFYRVICRYPEYAKKHQNVLLLPVVDTWVSDKAIMRLVEKTKECSLIASAKRNLEGHLLRHRIASWCKLNAEGVDLLGKGYRPFENKDDGLATYNYSIVIENNQEREYFTEKLLDCILCDTIPIYWGCPNIGDYFDINGIIICKNEDDIKRAVLKIDEKASQKQKAAMIYNKSIALNLSKLNQRIVDVLTNENNH